MQITLVKFGQPETIDVPEGTTVAQALEAHDIDPDSAIRFRGETVSGSELSVVLAPGEVVVAAPPDIAHGA